MEKKILPVGRQSFRKLQDENCIYVDKTNYIYDLCYQGGMYFVSRPRRFGKSLLLSTMSELFSGSRELFKGLWIEDKWDWSKKNPIIHISFLVVDYEKLGLEEGIRQYLITLFEEYGFEYNIVSGIKTLFFELIEQIYKQHGKVVILIDEYDKPIIDYLEYHKIEQAKANQEVLGLFYGALKEADAYIRLLFITGISKFTKVSLFSKLNNLNDLTLNPNYATMFGYTQTELEHYFKEYIDDVATVITHYNREELLEEIRSWYNGYSWDGKRTVYNPFGILLFLSNQDFQGYWFESGTPTFLAKRMLQEGYFELEDIETDFNFLNKYSLDNLELTSLLFQTGYLTIKEKGLKGEVVLSYPNQEVRRAMYNFLIDDMGNTRGGGGVTVRHLRKAFMDNDLDRVKNILVSLFAGLPFDVYQHQKTQQIEGFYHGLIHILFKYLGLHIQSEVHTSRGRADCVVETPAHIYLLEFKMNSDAAAALKQINTKKYAMTYTADNRLKIGIGINFNSETKEIDDWVTEELG